MDPLSIIASSIAVGTLATQTCKTLNALSVAIKGLPGRLHALNNEVVDLELVLSEVVAVFKGHDASILSESDKSNIPRLLRLAHAKLVELKSIIDPLRKSAGQPDTKITPFIVAFELKKQQSRLVDLQKDINSVKCSLNVMLGASNS